VQAKQTGELDPSPRPLSPEYRGEGRNFG